MKTFKQMTKKNVAVFGTGEIYNAIKTTIFNKYNVTHLFDNDKKKWGKEIDGLVVKSPSKIKALEFDKIIVASSHPSSIARQLKELGIQTRQIEIGANYIFLNAPTKNKTKIELFISAKQEIKCKFLAKDSELFWVEQSGAKILATQRNMPTIVSLWNNNNHLPYFFELCERYHSGNRGIFVDVGANIGTTSIEAARYDEVTRCIAFEPVSDNFSMLMANIYLNQLQSKIEAHNCAIGENEDKKQILISPHCSGDNRIRENKEAKFDIVSPDFINDAVRQETVRTVTIDSHLAQDLKDIKFLWVDVQGYEFFVLKGCMSLVEMRDVAIQIEYWPFGLRENGTIEALNSLLKRHFKYFVDLNEYGKGNIKPTAISEIDNLERKLLQSNRNAHTDIFLIR